MTFVFIFFTIISCRSGDGGLLEKESLFKIQYGRMEDQMNIVRASRDLSPRKNRIIMKNGIFHVSNGRSCKIMEFNSYGEILNLYYNSEKNPEPVILNESGKDDTTSTRNVFSYPFSDIGEIGIDSRKNLFIDDRIAENRIEMDEQLGVPLDRIILQFDQSGKYIDYLGQEGGGGTPFSYIEKIRLTLRDELVVFTRNTGGWKIFWFSPAGKPLYVVDIKNDALPFPDGVDEEYSFPDLETIDCDMTYRIIYLKIDYYTDHSKDPESEETGILFENSLIWNLDVREGRYDEYIEIPAYRLEKDKPQVYEDEVTNLLYEFIGTSGDGICYLISLNGRNSYDLMLLNRDGKVLEHRAINLGDNRLLVRELCISSDGIMTGLLGWEEFMEVAWWRTDGYLEKEGL